MYGGMSGDMGVMHGSIYRDYRGNIGVLGDHLGLDRDYSYSTANELWIVAELWKRQAIYPGALCIRRASPTLIVVIILT